MFARGPRRRILCGRRLIGGAFRVLPGGGVRIGRRGLHERGRVLPESFRRRVERLDQFAERLSVGIDVLENLVTGIAPGVSPSFPVFRVTL